MPIAIHASVPSMPSTPPPQVLFCPFCRECFEGQTECPEHELALVKLEELAPEHPHDDVPADDERVGPLDLRFGRGWIVAGIALAVIGFASPVLHMRVLGGAQSFTGWEAATGVAPNLWTVPFAAAMFAWMLSRRRTPLEMRGARLAGVMFGVAPILSALYTAWHVQVAARVQSEQSGTPIDISTEYGMLLIALASLALVIGSLRFGLVPRAERGPASAEPGARSPID